MIFSVFYTSETRQDLRDIYECITIKLCAQDAAKRQTERIMKAIRSLEQMPMRYRCYDEEPWHSQGLRCLPIDNYLILYLLDETTHTVNIIRIMYGGRDVKKQLDENTSLNL